MSSDALASHLLPYNRWVSVPKDAPGLARLLLALLLDNRLRTRLAAAARETALRFSPDVIADRCARPNANVIWSKSKGTSFLLSNQECVWNVT